MVGMSAGNWHLGRCVKVVNLKGENLLKYFQSPPSNLENSTS